MRLWVSALLSTMSYDPTMLRRIVSFELDDERHWRAKLECGHYQHVRHDPPLVSRPWVVTEAGRARFVGRVLDCLRCDAGTTIEGVACDKNRAIPPADSVRED